MFKQCCFFLVLFILNCIATSFAWAENRTVNLVVAYKMVNGQLMEKFFTFIEKQLVTQLKANHIVVMDNVKKKGLR